MQKSFLAGVAAMLAAAASVAAPKVTISPVNPNVIKVTHTPEGTSEEQFLTTPTGIVARVNGTTGEVTIDAGRGRGIYDNGLRTTDSLGRQTITLRQFAPSPLFGGGERGYSLDLAGDTLVMYNRQNYGYTGTDPRIKQMNITMPLIVSPRGYAILFDDYAEAQLLTGDPLVYSTISKKPVSYYFIASPEGFDKLPEQVTAVTGRQPLPPLWSLGYITSKYGYKTTEEVDSVVGALKKGGYPLDGIVLDLYWYGKEEDMGRLAWEPSQWPKPEKMLANLRKKGVNLVAISQPYVLNNGRGVDNYNLLASKGMFGKDSVGGVKEVKIWVGQGGMLDVSNPDTRAWLRNRYKQLTDGGITGWWGDLGEPEVHPDGMLHANGLTNREYHNRYGNDWASIIYDLFREEYPDTRLMTLMRGGTTGLQSQAVFPWSTDVSRSWGGLQPQVKIMLNAGLSGLGYMSHDVGGFAIDKENPIDPELYVRWLQLGLFSPVLRTHSQLFAEPYHYKEYEKDILLPLIKERYRWLPYNYTLAYENSATGMPLVRPVGMYAKNPGAYANVDDQFLWGRDLMVAPVLEQGARSRRVRIPEGVWVDYHNPATEWQGDTTVTVDAPLNRIPLFVRGGALLPKADYRMENTGQYRTDRYTIEYFPSQLVTSSQCEIYEDDLRSPSALADGRYALIDVRAVNTLRGLTFSVSAPKGSYPGMPAKREFTFVVHNADRPASVTSPTAKVRSSYNEATRTLTVTVTPTALPLDVIVAK